MNIEEILKEIIEKLDKYKIAYMITGSFASNLHGIPRATFDVDIVIEPSIEKIEKFLNEIKSEFYVNLEMAKEAVERKGIFNIIHYETAFKIDFIIRKEGEYFEKEFERRKVYNFAGRPSFFATPEDTILSKLLWAKLGNSEKQFRDALGVAKVQKENLDFEYLMIQAENLGIRDLLERLIINELKKE